MSTRKRKLSILVGTGLIALLLGAHVALSAPPWGIACGDGRVDVMLDDFDDADPTTVTTIFKADPGIQDPTLSSVAGCHGPALRVGYDLIDLVPGGPKALAGTPDTAGGALADG